MAEAEQGTMPGGQGTLLTRWETLLERVRPAAEAALRTGEPEELAAVREALDGRHPADIALVMEQLLPTEAAVVFGQLDDARAAEVLDELSTPLSRYLTDKAPRGRIAALLDALPMDDAAEVIAEATRERRQELLRDLDTLAPQDAAEVRELLSYGEKTAGRLMTDKFLRLSPDMTVEQAFAAIRLSDPVVETLSDLYVTEPVAGGEERLIGVLSLRHLVRQDPRYRIGDVMIPDPITATVDTDQQEVAQVIAKYDFLALPVLDRAGNLAGIITVDDVLDVVIEEFNEDYMRLVGSDAEEMERRTPAQVARLRLPWLLGTMLIELIAGVFIERFNPVIVAVPLIASFMPVISAISGNVGLQAAAIIVRGLETGHVHLQHMGRAVRKEFLTTVLMALICGSLLGIIGVIWSRHVTFGLVIGMAMTASMLTASVMGTIIPMLSKRLGFDPATTAGPFETAFQDVIGYTVFLWLASQLLPWLK